MSSERKGNIPPEVLAALGLNGESKEVQNEARRQIHGRARKAIRDIAGVDNVEAEIIRQGMSDEAIKKVEGMIGKPGKTRRRRTDQN